jgi:hypothetical protein
MAKFGRIKSIPKLSKKESDAARELMANPKFKARMAKIHSTPVVKLYDIPFLCGYSMDAKVVYCDRHFNTKWKGVDLMKFLKIHEIVEKAMIDLYDYHYESAHKIATYFESQAVTKAGMNFTSYQDYLKPFIKTIEDEKVQKVPRDLDLTPYKDEKGCEKLAKLLTKKEHLKETKISLEYHNELNPKLWDNWQLKPEVRDKLIEFAKNWADFAKLPMDIVQDIIMIGGNCNFNYTPNSDIDVHLVLDRNKINPDRALVDEYLQSKKTLWTLTHKISIYGYSLEPYAQGTDQPYQQGQGVYSLKRDEWIQRPEHGGYDFTADVNLKRKVLFYKRMIDNIIKNKMDEKTVKDLKRKMSDMRAGAIARGGEFSFENLIFKELRNRGYIDKLNKYEKGLKDQQLSLR